jgi:UDP-glucose 4-epimerase
VKVLIAGGAGYIGSTIASACLDSGITPIIVDNLVTGRREFATGRIFYEGDVNDGSLIDGVFSEHVDIYAAIHCAALINVPDSVVEPITYYTNNVSKSLCFASHLIRNGCTRFIFSSSASVYASGEAYEVNESSAIYPLSPYARSKATCEIILKDIANAGDLRVLSLRYFNPIGADPKMRTGLQLAHPTHALGKIIEATEIGETFGITGTDYPTRDGSGIRDYVHVWDLAEAHLTALQRFDNILHSETMYEVINLGTGRGTTVKELIETFNVVSKRPVTTFEAPRRPGDNAGSFASNAKAQSLLNWSPRFSLVEGIEDSLRWSEVRQAVLGDG